MKPTIPTLPSHSGHSGRHPVTGVTILSCLGLLTLGLALLLGGCGEADESDPCAACGPDQLCVQINDSSTLCHSSKPTIMCQTVSATCKASIQADKSCAGATIECSTELCSSPYQCRISPPCGNESPKAQLYCYGP
jgi:hypothetical protein